MTFNEIWNEAYNIYTDPQKEENEAFADMKAFLMERVQAGNLDYADMLCMIDDIFDTASL